MKLRCFLCMFLLWLLTGSAFGQMHCITEHYSTEDGLSHDVITSIFKDKQGYMWFGTWDGLNRFDGRKFTVFKSLAGDSSQINNNRIDQITEDNYDHLWIKAYDSQIYRFDKKTGRFLSLAVILNLKEKIIFDKILSLDQDALWVSTINNGIFCVSGINTAGISYRSYGQSATTAPEQPSKKYKFFYGDSEGKKWIGTEHGLLCLEKRQKNGSYEIADLDKHAEEAFTCVAESKSQLFFGTRSGTLYLYDKQEKQFSKQRISTADINAILVNRSHKKAYLTTGNGELLSFTIGIGLLSRTVYQAGESLHTIFEDNSGALWIEPRIKGVIRFDLLTQKFTTFVQKNDAKKNNFANHFKVIEDKNGVVWCVLRDGGFGYYDNVSKQFNYFYNEPGSNNRRFSNLVTTVYYDPAGIFWLHTDEHGIEKIIFPPSVFQTSLLNEHADFQSDNEVRGICADRQNRLWFGLKNGQVLVYKNGKQLPVTFANFVEQNIGGVYCITQDRNGVIWMGTKTKGLYQAIPTDPSELHYRLINYRYDPSNPASINSDEIYSIKEDKEGHIWIGTFDNGLCLLSRNNGNVSFTRLSDNGTGYPQTCLKIRHLAMDANGRLWIAATGGLVILNYKNGKLLYETYKKTPGNPQSLGNNDIQHIYRDSKNQMWLVTSGGGLNLAVSDPQTGLQKFKAYTSKQGLANDYVMSCIGDGYHHLWLATKAGLSMFDLNTRKFKNFNSYDGIPKKGFSESSCQAAKDGKLVFGAVRGYMIFDPGQVKNDAIKVNLVLTNLLVNNRDVAIKDSTRILDRDINYADGVRLKHDQNIFSLDYAVLDYRSGNHLTIAYRLKGFDNEWHEDSDQQRVTYTNLPAGNYTFEIKCNDPDRFINVPYKSLAITVLAAPWASWWAYIIYAIIICAILAAIRQNALTVLKLKQKVAVEQKMTELKLSFFTNISHELRTPLTLIINPINELVQRSYLSRDDRQYLTIIQRNANRMVRFVNQLLEFRKVQSGKAKLNLSAINMVELIADVAGYFEEMRQLKNIEFAFKTDVDTAMVWLDPEKIETVLYNLIANAYKFTPERKKITVHLQMKDTGDMIIDITDEGCGVLPSEIDSLFDLYTEGSHPNTGHLKGTGIGLALSKELVELHQGTISAQNGEPGGCWVRVTLPVNAVKTIAPVDASVPEGKPRPALLQPPHADLKNEQIVHNEPLLILVEDNQDMRELIRMQLSGKYRIETAANGVEGWEKILKLQPDVILSDVMMPRMDGLELLGKIRNDAATSHIPVVLLTAKTAVESQIAGLSYGADYYITKPFDTSFLLTTLKNIIERRRRLVNELMTGKAVVSLNPGDIIVTSKDEIFLKKVLELIDAGMDNPDFNIESVAEVINMSRQTFYRKLKSLTQLSPVEFVRDHRLLRAQQLLDAGSDNISQIAYAVGFNSPKYFATCFKAKFNISPSDYQKMPKPSQEIIR
ncbi:Two component regulator propeller [Mucilaginibacter sp. OK268]|nr:Two component regulator propeller [Mucilaginibacter sp. OK268]